MNLRHRQAERQILRGDPVLYERGKEVNLQGAPDLAVEVLSRSTRGRDLGIKHELYERHGVEEYWIVDPETESAEVRRRVSGRLTTVAELDAVAGASLTSPLLPGLEIPLRSLEVGGRRSLPSRLARR